MQKVSYMGNGSTTEFTFNFSYFESTDVVVTKNGALATGYNIIGNSGGLDADIPYTGGRVIFETAPGALDNITIARNLPMQRQYDYQQLAKIDPTTLNQDMNYLMEVLKDVQDEIDTLHTQYSEIADKESTATLLSRIDTVSEEISDFQESLDNHDFMYMQDFNCRITNCITEIPQDIKLELNNGTLTLKAGSKVYVPNGSGVFDTVTISADRSNTITSDDTYMIFAESDGSGILYRRLSSQTGSGTTTPTSGYNVYYNTSDNKVYKINNGVNTGRASFPIALVTVSGGAISSIDQIFNGFGFIGSTVFALPGVVGFVPNGRNLDGTLNNTKYQAESVIIYSQNLTGTKIPLYVKNNNTMTASSTFSYNQDNNIIESGGYYQVGSISVTSGVISKLSIKHSLRIADNYDL